MGGNYAEDYIYNDGDDDGGNDGPDAAPMYFLVTVWAQQCRSIAR